MPAQGCADWPWLTPSTATGSLTFHDLAPKVPLDLLPGLRVERGAGRQQCVQVARLDIWHHPGVWQHAADVAADHVNCLIAQRTELSTAAGAAASECGWATCHTMRRPTAGACMHAALPTRHSQTHTHLLDADGVLVVFQRVGNAADACGGTHAPGWRPTGLESQLACGCSHPVDYSAQERKFRHGRCGPAYKPYLLCCAEVAVGQC